MVCLLWFLVYSDWVYCYCRRSLMPRSPLSFLQSAKSSTLPLCRWLCTFFVRSKAAWAWMSYYEWQQNIWSYYTSSLTYLPWIMKKVSHMLGSWSRKFLLYAVSLGKSLDLSTHYLLSDTAANAISVPNIPERQERSQCSNYTGQYREKLFLTQTETHLNSPHTRNYLPQYRIKISGMNKMFFQLLWETFAFMVH